MSDQNIRILWADDEIEMLKPQLVFLEKKGYDVITVTNGYDALEEIKNGQVLDVVFLDETMPGMTGLETLSEVKSLRPSLPVVMITKNEAENLMEEAIGAQIDDYLIKPVNPNQILLALKKIIDNKRLVREKTTSEYQQEFRKILMDITSGLDYEEWVETYRKIINWEIKLDDSESEDMQDILSSQKSEANKEFSKYIVKNYMDWMDNIDTDERDNRPVLSHELMREKVFPTLSDDRPTVFLLLDNLRFDQWKTIESRITDLFRIKNEDYFYSILPTATQYSRNAIFSGLMPGDIANRFSQWWVNDHEEGGKNDYEKELLDQLIRRVYRKEMKFDYVKITKVDYARKLQDDILDYLHNDLMVIVYNFIDMVSHARTEMEVLKELAGDEKAYRSLTNSWFANSPLWSALERLADRDVQLIVTTDHGTIRVDTPSKVIGDRDTTPNLRYKMGKNLQYDSDDVLDIGNPEKAHLPRPFMSARYIFATGDKYFLYPNNYNYYMNYYRDTFQHGGISPEEMICPFITLESK